VWGVSPSTVSQVNEKFTYCVWLVVTYCVHVLSRQKIDMSATVTTANAAASDARLNAIIPQRSLKEFARIVSFLNKIGDELNVEAGPNKLRLSAVNPARTVFASTWFGKGFFDEYKGAVPGGPILRCQMPNKVAPTNQHRPTNFITRQAVQLVFKQKASLEKTVERCVITLNPRECRLNFQLQCKHGWFGVGVGGALGTL